jgi:hypothetical protein
MKTGTKIAIALGVLLMLGAVGFGIKTGKDMSDKLSTLQQQNVEIKQLQDGIVRSSSSYVSKDDLDTFSKKLGVNLATITSDMKTIGDKVEGINNVLVATQGYHGTNIGSGGTIPRPTVPGQPTVVDKSDPFHYLTNEQLIQLNEPIGSDTVPFGKAGFSAWQPKPWEITVYPRDYSVSTVLGQDVEGKHTVYNKFTVTTQGKTFTVPIKESKFEEVAPAASITFNPRIYLGISGGIRINTVAPQPPPHGEFTPTVSAFLFSYGQTKATPQWSALGVGIGVETVAVRPVLAITPITFNIGSKIPLMSNLHIAPTVTVDTAGAISILGGLHVGL